MRSCTSASAWAPALTTRSSFSLCSSCRSSVVICFTPLKQMTTEEQEELIETELRAVRRGVEGVAEVHARIAPRFRRAEVRTRARHFLEGLLAPVERKNGWQR